MGGTMASIRKRLLAVPEVETTRDGGHTSVFVRLQRGRAARGTQPDPRTEIVLYQDSEGVPVSVKFFDPVPPAAMLRVLAVCVRMCPRDEPVLVDRLLTAFAMAAARLAPRRSGAA